MPGIEWDVKTGALTLNVNWDSKYIGLLTDEYIIPKISMHVMGGTIGEEPVIIRGLINFTSAKCHYPASRSLSEPPVRVYKEQSGEVSPETSQPTDNTVSSASNVKANVSKVGGTRSDRGLAQEHETTKSSANAQRWDKSMEFTLPLDHSYTTFQVSSDTFGTIGMQEASMYKQWTGIPKFKFVFHAASNINPLIHITQVPNDTPTTNFANIADYVPSLSTTPRDGAVELDAQWMARSDKVVVADYKRAHSQTEKGERDICKMVITTPLSLGQTTAIPSEIGVTVYVDISNVHFINPDAAGYSSIADRILYTQVTTARRNKPTTETASLSQDDINLFTKFMSFLRLNAFASTSSDSQKELLVDETDTASEPNKPTA